MEFPELDAYERESATRIGAFAAHEARRELEAHLHADFQARLELGTAPGPARIQSLEALGDLRRIVREEPVDRHDAVLAAIPTLFLLTFVAQALILDAPDRMFSDLSLASPDVRMLLPSIVAILAGVVAARGRTRPDLRPLLRGGLVAVGTCAVLMLAVGTRGAGSALSLFTIWTLLPALFAYVASIALTPWVRADRELPGAWAMRLLAWPLGMFLVGHARFLSVGNLAWSSIWPTVGLLLTLGMLGRRRLDLPTAAAASVLGILANGRLHSLLTGYGPSLAEVPEYLVKFGMLLVIQAIALGIWSLLRAAPLRRLAR